MTDEIITFVVTDIESDGPSPLANSMLSFASVACDVTGKVLSEFEWCSHRAPTASRAPTPWPGGQPSPKRIAATENPEPPEMVMPRYADWVEACRASTSLPRRR